MSVDTRDLMALERRFGSLGGAILRDAVQPMQRVVRANERGAKQDVRVDRGGLRRSITSTVEIIGNLVIGRWGSNLPYTRANEFGRRPDMKWPPPGVLLGWMRRHGIDPGKPPKKRRTNDGRRRYLPVEFVIARKIGKLGIPAQPFLRRPKAELDARIRREFGGLAAAVRTHLVTR
jgi:hypothetical protein